MIKINLLEAKKPIRMPVVMGVDLALLNLKLIGVAVVLDWIIGPQFISYWQEMRSSQERSNEQIRSKLAEVRNQGRGSSKIQEEIELMKKRESELNEKLQVVKSIIKIKKNPVNILLYISKKIPEDMWITSLDIENDKVSIQGNSRSYRSIGLFQDGLENSIFFNSDLRLEDSGTITDEKSGFRSEKFRFTASIKRYE